MIIYREGSNSVYWRQKLLIDENTIKNINDFIARDVRTGNFPVVTEAMIAEAFNAIDNNKDALGVFHMIDDVGNIQEMKVACYIVDIIEEYMNVNCDQEVFDADNYNYWLPFIATED